MTDSPHYTDHMIAALRCLDDDQLRKLATNILNRLPDNSCNECGGCKGYQDGKKWIHCHVCGGTGVAFGALKTTDREFDEPSARNATLNPIECKLTMEEKLAYVQKLKEECNECEHNGFTPMWTHPHH